MTFALKAGTLCPWADEEIRRFNLLNLVSSFFALITHQTASRLYDGANCENCSQAT